MPGGRSGAALASFPFRRRVPPRPGSRARRRLAEELPGAEPDGRDPGGAGVRPPRSPLPARGAPVTSAPRSLGAPSGSGDEPEPGCRASLPILPLRKWCAALAGAEAEAAAALGELLFTGGVGRAAELSPAADSGERRQTSGRRPGLEPRSRVGLGTQRGLLTCAGRYVNHF